MVVSDDVSDLVWESLQAAKETQRLLETARDEEIRLAKALAEELAR